MKILHILRSLVANHNHNQNILISMQQEKKEKKKFERSFVIFI